MAAAGAALLHLSLPVSLPAPAAHAGCVAGAPEIVWSVPAHGATDVPSDVAPVVVTSLGNRPSAQLDGFDLTPGGAPVPYDFEAVPALATEAEHVLDVHVARESDGTPSADFTIRFRTAPADAALPGPPQVRLTGLAVRDESEATFADLSELCRAVQRAQECFDYGVAAFVSADVVHEGGAPPAFYVIGPDRERDTPFSGRTVLWPADCGPPGYYRGRRAENACVVITPGDVWGRLGPTVAACEDDFGAAGCAAAPGAAGAGAGASLPLIATAVALLALGRCRAGRRRSPPARTGWPLFGCQ